MRYFQKRRTGLGQGRSDPLGDESEGNDPLAGVANLLDLGLVFMVGLLVTVFSAYHMQDMFNKNSEMTIVKKKPNGQMEIIRKEGEEIEARKVTKKKAKGRGERLGTAYRLQDGTMVYVPEE